MRRREINAINASKNAVNKLTFPIPFIVRALAVAVVLLLLYLYLHWVYFCILWRHCLRLCSRLYASVCHIHRRTRWTSHWVELSRLFDSFSLWISLRRAHKLSRNSCNNGEGYQRKQQIAQQVANSKGYNKHTTHNWRTLLLLLKSFFAFFISFHYVPNIFIKIIFIVAAHY